MMMLAQKVRSTRPRDISNLLEAFALRGFDNARMPGCILRALYIYEASGKAEGEFFRILLLELGRDIDWKLCAEIEKAFMAKVKG